MFSHFFDWFLIFEIFDQRYIYLDGFGIFLVIFVQKYIFLPLLKKFWAKKITFLAIFQKYDF